VPVCLYLLKPQKNGNRNPSSVAVSCSKNQGGLRGGARFRRRRRPSCPAKPEFCVKNQAESADDGGGCESALNGPIDTPDPRQAQPSHHGGEEKQQTHDGLLGTKLMD
jgi:hypothetical protein